MDVAGRFYGMAFKKTKPSSISCRAKEVKNVAYGTYLGVIVSLSWNVLAVTTLWIHGRVETQNLCLAIAYLLIGIPAAYWSWHRELNLAFRAENSFNFHRFLVFYLLHIVFCLFASLDPYAEKSLAGIVSGMIVYFDDGLARVGILYFIGSVFFFVEYVISIRVLSHVHKLYLQGGFSLLDDDDDDDDLECTDGFTA